MGRWSDGFTNAFLLIYAADGVLSLLEELLRAATGQTALLGARNALALPVLSVALLAIPFLALTPRLPARLLLPLFVSVIWLNHGAAPLPLWLAPSLSGIAASGLQVVFALLAYGWVLRRRGGLVWSSAAETPAFSVDHALRVFATLVLGLLPAGVLYGALLLATTVQVGTNGFVAFDRGGITLGDRRYVREDREIRLVGMMHIGEADAYRDLVSSFSTESTVVLEEGLTDEGRRMETPLSYDGVAGILGLETQQDLTAYLADPDTRELPEWPVLRHADVDLSAFSPETVAWLVQASSLPHDPASAISELTRLSSQRPEVLAAVEHDVFELRNEHLIGEIGRALESFERVVVPWGALHLPAIEAAILEQGFVPTTRERRRLVSWGTVGAALLR